MDQEIPVQQLVCSKHKFNYLDLIHLTGQADKGRICQICVLQNQIPQDEILSIKDIFTKKKDELLSSYPPFKSKLTKELIEGYSQKNSPKKKIEKFFKQLRINVEKAIQFAENRAKQKFMKDIEGQSILFEEINRISELESLKEHLMFSSSQKLNQFLKQKWRNAGKNDQAIQAIIEENDVPQLQLNLKEKQIEISKLIQSLKNFSLFEEDEEKEEGEQYDEEEGLQWESQHQTNFSMSTSLNTSSNRIDLQGSQNIIYSTNLIKSLKSNSQNLTVSKTLNGSLQLINDTQTDVWGQAYLDFLLNPKFSYTIRLNYYPKGYDSNFIFGIVADQYKDNYWCNQISKMSYFNKNSDYGISKYLKGPKINTGAIRCQKEKFEVLIQLDEKVLQVSSFPDQESILTLDDPNKIVSDIPYRFFACIGKEGDKIKITDILQSDKF